MARPQAPRGRSVLNKQHPGGPCVNTAGWQLNSVTEAYETSEGSRVTANEAAWVMFFDSVPPHGLTSWE